jgi:acetyl-CoA carboxylase carboxyltransferase component
MSKIPVPPPEGLRERCAAIGREEAVLREGGGKAGQDRQHKMGRLLARERINRLLDPNAKFFEVGLWAAYKMYEQWGQIAAAGAVVGIGNIASVPCMVIANDATVKAGAFFPATTKKLIRAQRIAFECGLAPCLPRRFGRRVLANAGRDFSR